MTFPYIMQDKLPSVIEKFWKPTKGPDNSSKKSIPLSPKDEKSNAFGSLFESQPKSKPKKIPKEEKSNLFGSFFPSQPEPEPEPMIFPVDEKPNLFESLIYSLTEAEPEPEPEPELVEDKNAFGALFRTQAIERKPAVTPEPAPIPAPAPKPSPFFSFKAKTEPVPAPEPVTEPPPKIPTFSLFGNANEVEPVAEPKPELDNERGDLLSSLFRTQAIETKPEPVPVPSPKPSPFFSFKANPELVPAPEPVQEPSPKIPTFSLFGNAKEAAPKVDIAVDSKPKAQKVLRPTREKSPSISQELLKIPATKPPTKNVFGAYVPTDQSKVESPKRKSKLNPPKKQSLNIMGRPPPPKKKKPTVTRPPRPSVSVAKSDTPILRRFVQNGDGSITGFVYNSKSFPNGTEITTSAVRPGAKAGTVVKTSSGSMYKLE